MWSNKTSILGLAFCFVAEIRAQTTNATCLPVYEWAFNSHMKSPCELASTLLAACTGGLYFVPALPANTHYLGPALESTNPCQCNTVVYSVMSACAACQDRIFDTWSTWSGNCATVYINSYPEAIPSNASVPAWAYLDVHDDIFNETAAREDSYRSGIESTAMPPLPTPSGSSSLQATVSTAAPASGSVQTNDSDNTSNQSRSPANIVMGGVVGGIIGLVSIIGVGYWYFSSTSTLKIRRAVATSAGLSAEDKLEGPVI